MKYKIWIVMFLTWFFMAGTANAALQLELTHGVNAALPVAIVPFASQASDKSTSDGITQIIHNDLQTSGRFDVMPVAKLKQFPNDVTTVDFNYWKKTGVNNIVIGEINPLNNGQYQVKFSLLNVYLGSNKNGQAEQSPVIISERYVVKKDDFRQLAHRISDIIYQQLTSERGVFSTRIAYVLVEEKPNHPIKYMLEVADTDGFNPSPLLESTQPIMSPRWSPDGKEIAYVSFEKKRTWIYVEDIATGKRRVITNYPGINGAPAWSPDGKKLALTLSFGKHPNIYIYDLGGRKLEQLTKGAWINTEPSWAPDGQSLIYTSNRGGSPQIYQYSFKDAKTQRVTFDGRYNASGSFTSDGKKIIMLHKDQNGFNIALQELDSGALTVLTKSGFATSPSVAPNSQMIIYATNKKKLGELAIVSADGNVSLRLPAPEGSVQEPAWSPFRQTS